MNIDVLAFGIAKDIIGTNVSKIETDGPISIAELKNLLVDRYPEFEKLKSFSIAVNQEYQEEEFLLQSNDEIAIIPPVSGG